MTEYNWCQRCGGESYGKQFCKDCSDRLKIHEEYKKNYKNGDLLRKLGIKVN